MKLLDQIVEVKSEQRARLARLRASHKPKILYGAGVYAYVLKRLLDAEHIALSAVMVDAAYRPERPFLGFTPLITEESADLLRTSQVIVGVVNYPPVVDKLRRLGAGEIHVIDVPDYLNLPHPFMDLEFVRAHAESFERAASLLADDLSRATYAALINCKINEDLAFLQPHVRLDKLYFPQGEFHLDDDEVLLDVGAFTGDTVREFHHLRGGRYARIIALEPDEDNFAQLLATIAELGLDKVVALQVGAWDETTTLRFVGKEMHIDNQIAADGEKRIAVEPIDALLARLNVRVSLLKLDINGAEYRALCGASETIRRDRPRIAVRLHTREDLFRVPILLNRLLPEARLYVRQRNFMSMMAVLYAVIEPPAGV